MYKSLCLRYFHVLTDFAAPYTKFPNNTKLLGIVPIRVLDFYVALLRTGAYQLVNAE